MGFFLGYLALYIDFFLSLQVQFKRLIIMQILLANAKIMFEKADRKPISLCHYSNQLPMTWPKKWQ